MKITCLGLLVILISCNTNPNSASVQKKEFDSSTSTNQLDIAKENTRLTRFSDTLIRGERIDGPANIRDTVNGNLLFVLNDNVHVSATEAEGGWLQVGILADITEDEWNKNRIKKGSQIILDGRVVGTAISDFTIGSMKTNEGLLGEVVGYTSIKNIKPNTVPENALNKILNGREGPIKFDELDTYLKEFEIHSFDSLIKGAEGYMLHENWVDDPSPLLRLWFIFKDEELIGIFHSRALSLSQTRTVSVERSFLFTFFGRNAKDSSNLIKEFNAFIVQVD